ncbi:MAG TPA: hypothetical protein VIT45_07290 [Allosphingosinicella sp.]
MRAMVLVVGLMLATASVAAFGFDDSMKNWVEGAPIQSRQQSEER